MLRRTMLADAGEGLRNSFRIYIFKKYNLSKNASSLSTRTSPTNTTQPTSIRLETPSTEPPDLPDSRLSRSWKNYVFSMTDAQRKPRLPHHPEVVDRSRRGGATATGHEESAIPRQARDNTTDISLARAVTCDRNSSPDSGSHGQGPCSAGHPSRLFNDVPDTCPAMSQVSHRCPTPRGKAIPYAQAFQEYRIYILTVLFFSFHVPLPHRR